MPSRRFATVVVFVIVVAFLVVAVAPAFAATPKAAPASLVLHARLLGSTPTDGGTVATAAEVVLAFNEEVDPTFVMVTVEGPDGSEVGGPPSVEGREVTQVLSPALPVGEHVVTYRVVSTDGHPVSGTATFTTTTAPTPSAEPTASAASSSTPSPTTAPVAEASSVPWGLILVALGVGLLLGLLVVKAVLGAAGRRDRAAANRSDAGSSPEVDPGTGDERNPFA